MSAGRLIAIALALGTPALGGTIFDNGSPQLDPGGQGIFSDAAPGLIAGMFPQFVAEDFSLTGPDEVAGMTYYGGFFPGNVPDPSFGINFYSDLGGNPDALIASRSVTPNLTPLGGTISGVQAYRFDAFFAPVSLPGSTPLWVSVFNTNAADGNSDFIWAFTSTPLVSSAFSIDLNLWFPTPTAGFREAAFQLSGVPEPSTFALLGLGLAGAAIRRRRAQA